MAAVRIKPYSQLAAEAAARQRQVRAFRRNQIFGLMILAGIVCLWRLLHTHPGWIFPAGWWRW